MLDFKIHNWRLERIYSPARQLKDREDALPRMVNAIQHWGFRISILVSADGEVIDGELRLAAARKLGMEEVPVLVQDDLTVVAKNSCNINP